MNAMQSQADRDHRRDLHMAIVADATAAAKCESEAYRVVMGAVSFCAGSYGVAIDDIMAPTQGERKVSMARQSAMLIARMDGLTYQEIATVMGRDHTTIIHGVRTALTRIDKQTINTQEETT